MADLDNDSGGGAREQDRFLPINVMTPKRRCRSAYRSSSASSPDKPPTSARERRGRPSTATICCGP
ncbi:hypothetical protein DVH24_014355 [Malus domestica]|uniref:Uncharacterized protein n=1 Tax=Malus domestica TaxID=3750 RepID=A0A498IWU7_MALDO|nr:hypothetical protein DVH24_014355 [Malus domestica]